MLAVEELSEAVVVRMDDGGVNTLDTGTLDAVTRLVDELAEAPAVVITGNSRVFSAGLDLRRVIDGGSEYISDLLPALCRALLAIYDHPRPVVAAVNGHALAGGCVVAAACDLRLMSGGTIGLPELRVGVPFPVTVLEIVRFAFGGAAAELVLTGRTFTPAEARQAGVVHDVVDPDALLAEAVRRAGEMGRMPSAAFAMTKEQLHRPTRVAIEQARALDDPRANALWSDPATATAIMDFVATLAHRNA